MQLDRGEWFADVDRSRTRAYCLGLTGIVINGNGREGQGIVEEEAELRLLKRQLVTRLTGLADADTGQLAIREVQDAAVMFSGPYLDNGPDLLLGFNAGYRISSGVRERQGHRLRLREQHEALERRPLRRSQARPRHLLL